ncbi:hypothetical protein M422DRAFT_242719 [Sphaerobolus stellatus SS14]|nr:hypothetical protein M422DRAFT_242719 [Sphaerobolus stellatus SS14]
MPAIYGIISFLSFRSFRDYTYYSLVEVVYEVYPSLHVLIAMVLIIFNCHSFVVWVIRLIALYGLILFYNLTRTELVSRRPLAKFLCIKGTSRGTASDAFAILILTHSFLGIVILTFYQEFVFSVLQKYKVIHATEFWTATNVADGLNALATTIEASCSGPTLRLNTKTIPYPKQASEDHYGIASTTVHPLLHTYPHACTHLSPHATADFGHEIFGSVAFFIRYLLDRPNTHTSKGNSYPAQSSSYQGVQIPQASTSRIDFGDAFGLWDPENKGGKKKVSTHKNSSSYDEESQAVLAPEYDVREDGEFVGQGRESGRYEHNLSSFSEIDDDILMRDFKDGESNARGTNPLFNTAQFGQHILKSSSIAQRIMDAANIKATDHVLEVEPGTGNLTVHILKKAKQIIADISAPERRKLDIIIGDFVKADLPYFDVCISNTPYQISSPLVF